MKFLFITWDGPYVSYLDGLFLPILSALGRFGYEFHIFHFSWADPSTIQRIAKACEASGVPYRHVRIPKWPLSLGKLWTLMAAPRRIRRYIKGARISWLMPRTMMPARMVLELRRRNPGIRIVFDADGLPIEERIDFAGLRKGSLRYRMLKRIERDIIRHADRVLTRSNQAIKILTGQYGETVPFFKVLNGRDEGLFKPCPQDKTDGIRRAMGIPTDAFVVIYAGSLGAPYCVDEMKRFHEIIRRQRPDTWLVILSGSPAPWAGSMPRTVVKRVAPNEVPDYLSIGNVALAFRRQTFSMKGVSPIKLGEYFLCGLPVIASGGIGDTDEIFAGQPFCYVLDSLDEGSLGQAAGWALNARRSPTIREFGVIHFGLDAAVTAYRQALQGIKEGQ